MSDSVARKNRLKRLIAAWKKLVTPAVGEHAPRQTYLADLKHTRLAALKKELAGIEPRERRSRKPRGVKHHRLADAEEEGAFIAPDFQERFFAYPKAMRMLGERLGATREELAARVPPMDYRGNPPTLRVNRRAKMTHLRG